MLLMKDQILLKLNLLDVIYQLIQDDISNFFSLVFALLEMNKNFVLYFCTFNFSLFLINFLVNINTAGAFIAWAFVHFLLLFF